MIGRIRGELVDKQAPEILIDANGVGYELTVPMTTYYDLPDLGQPVVLVCHFHVREDAQQLYGFSRRSERDLFRILIKVSGIGPKVGLAILSGMTASEVVRCIQNGDKKALTKLPGIGPKTAERLIMETRDKIKQQWGEAGPTVTTSQPSSSEQDPVAEAEAALEALGYKKAEASRAVARAALETDMKVESLIRTALRALG